MTVEYVDLVDYIAIASEITGLEVETVMRVTRLDLADSALHAPAAGFGETEFYPDFVDKSAVLVVRLAKNHPLPDGNKRAAWVALRLFVELNRWTWQPTPSIDDAERAMLAIAAGDWPRRDGSVATRPPGRSDSLLAASRAGSRPDPQPVRLTGRERNAGTAAPTSAAANPTFALAPPPSPAGPPALTVVACSSRPHPAR